MYQILFPQSDATVYSQFPEKNTGTDEIIELMKSTHGTPSLENDNTVYYAETHNSRILMKFDLSEVSKSISSGKIDQSTVQYFLTLSAAETLQLPIEYTILAFPVSASWNNGTGHYNNSPQCTDGVSWQYKTSKYVANTWQTSSYAIGATGSYQTTAGGGNWFTSSVASQSFNCEAADLRMDVTSIVNKWISGAIVNDGFIIKFPDITEQDNTIISSIRFFSKDSNTIYLPKLEIYWDSADLSGTGSFSEIGSDDFVLNAKNLRETYSTQEKPKVRFSVRERFPTQTYATSSVYLESKRLPTGSYFQIQDVVTDEIIVPFNDVGTKVNCDANGNYIQIDCSSIMPERYYKLIVKSLFDGGDTIRTIDGGHIFRIRRN